MNIRFREMKPATKAILSRVTDLLINALWRAQELALQRAVIQLIVGPES